MARRFALNLRAGRRIFGKDDFQVRKAAALTLLLVAAIAVLLLCPFIGMKTLSLSSVYAFGSAELDHEIFWKIRLPRVLLAFLAGAGLAMSGMTFQALFRNPLADPYVLGISSGASFGATLYLCCGLGFSIIGISGISFFAFSGAVLSVLLVYGITRIRHGFSASTLLLAGVAVNFFFSSIILLIQYMSNFTDSFRILRWLMGGIEVVGMQPVLGLAPFFLLGGILVLIFLHELNLMTTGEELAVSRGVNARRTKQCLFAATSLLVGGVVACCGPIGFVGMIAPHICRLLVGWNHKYLAPATLLFGGLFLALCDTIARTLLAPVEIPVGVITALLGGPFFMWLLLRGESEKSMF